MSLRARLSALQKAQQAELGVGCAVLHPTETVRNRALAMRRGSTARHRLVRLGSCSLNTELCSPPTMDQHTVTGCTTIQTHTCMHTHTNVYKHARAHTHTHTRARNVQLYLSPLKLEDTFILSPRGISG